MPLAKQSKPLTTIGTVDRPSTADLEQFERDGFLVAPGFFDPSELAEIRQWTDELSAMPEAPAQHMVYYEDSLTVPGLRVVQRIENFCVVHSHFDHLIRMGKLARYAHAFLGGPAVLFKDKINFKLPGGSGFPAHQDQQAGWTKYAPVFVTGMVSIDHSTLQNGCLELVAGAHRKGQIADEWHPLIESELELEAKPTDPGDVIFFNSFVPHASKPNFTDKPRRLLFASYNRTTFGDHRECYFATKRRQFPPDIERLSGEDAASG
jgi:ectoine hydroxylase-related dioxygenase (phytanoyl-CoA dioxygenase family)